MKTKKYIRITENMVKSFHLMNASDIITTIIRCRIKNDEDETKKLMYKLYFKRSRYEKAKSKLENNEKYLEEIESSKYLNGRIEGTKKDRDEYLRQHSYISLETLIFDKILEEGLTKVELLILFEYCKYRSEHKKDYEMKISDILNKIFKYKAQPNKRRNHFINMTEKLKTWGMIRDYKIDGYYITFALY